MKIAHLADLHVTEGPRLEDQRDVLGRVAEQVRLATPDLVVIAGDLYGQTVPHRSTPAERGVLFPFVVALARVAPVVIVQGNHDHAEDLLGLDHLGGDWPIRVSTRAETYALSTPAGIAQVYALPYPRRSWLLEGERPAADPAATQATVDARLAALLDGWREHMAALVHPTPRVLVGHVSVRGSIVGAGVVIASREIEITREQLASLPVDYVALGHLHDCHGPTDRAMYAGSLWHTAHSFAELPERGWLLVDAQHTDGRMSLGVTRMRSSCRPFVSLAYRWARATEDGAAAWQGRPKVAEALVRGSEVRARLVVPAQDVATCPWDAELARLEELGAERVVSERVIEPVCRVRAPEVSEAPTTAGKVSAYWRTIATPPTAPEQTAALDVLAEIEGHDDETVTARSDALMGE